MNYGKKSAAQKRNSLISRSSMMGKRARVSFIRLLFVSLIALCIGVTCLGIGSFKGVIDNAPDVDDIDIMPLGYATFLYDDQGNQIRKLAAPDANRLPVTLEQIPVELQHAVVAIEDERFYEHNGIDVRGILRAGVKALTSGDFSEGASTITQQLLKNNVFTNWTSESTQLERFTRKFQEQYLAIQVADCHIYDRHIPVVKEMIKRKPYPAPIVKLNPEVKDFYQFTTDDLIVENYETWPQIKNIPVAI